MSAEQSGSVDGRKVFGQDHLDHLRKSHFFLISAAGLLIVAALSHQESRTLIAYEDAQQISSSASRFDSLSVGSIIEREMLAGAPERVLVSHMPFADPSRGPGYKAAERYVVDLDSASLWTASPFPDSSTRLTATPSVAPVRVRTLGDWISLWETLGYSTICRAGRESGFIGQIRSPASTGAVSVTRDTGDVGDGETRARRRGHYVISHLAGSSDFTLWLLFYDDELPPGSAPFRSAPRRNPHFVSLSCSGTSNLESQRIASRIAGKPWVDGHFRESFRDLSGFTDGLSGASLKNIADMLKTEFASGARDVEVVGLPIPIGMLVEGGLLLVLALQIYLLLHLRAFDARALETHSIAWIGFYDDPVSWLVYSASIFALPIACGFILVQKAATRGPGEAPYYLVEFGLIVALSCVLLLTHPRRGPGARYRRFFRGLWRDLTITTPIKPAHDDSRTQDAPSSATAGPPP